MGTNDRDLIIRRELRKIENIIYKLEENLNSNDLRRVKKFLNDATQQVSSSIKMKENIESSNPSYKLNIFSTSIDVQSSSNDNDYSGDNYEEEFSSENGNTEANNTNIPLLNSDKNQDKNQDKIKESKKLKKKENLSIQNDVQTENNSEKSKSIRDLKVESKKELFEEILKDYKIHEIDLDTNSIQNIILGPKQITDVNKRKIYFFVGLLTDIILYNYNKNDKGISGRLTISLFNEMKINITLNKEELFNCFNIPPPQLVQYKKDYNQDFDASLKEKYFLRPFVFRATGLEIFQSIPPERATQDYYNCQVNLKSNATNCVNFNKLIAVLNLIEEKGKTLA